MDYITSLRTTIWRTSSARYNAARRLKRKELFSTISLAFFSVQTIALALVQKIFAAKFIETPGLDDYATVVSVLAGILIIVISLMEWGSRNGSNADAIYKNAEELNGLQRTMFLALAKANAGCTQNWDAAKSTLEMYEEIQSRCDINHSSLDDRFFVAQHRESPEFSKKQINWLEYQWVSFLWFLSSIWYYLIFWAVAAVAMIPILTRVAFI
ncbi:SLATT domain-containing protein [Pseudomonas syringae]|uniref:SLATT domain-containing protein n=1 Tax=Pseudomonas syringae TaxID=317 RepID=UPI0004656CDE|nr:SLATT domain-containing protein [Pseudomonas syringae]